MDPGAETTYFTAKTAYLFKLFVPFFNQLLIEERLTSYPIAAKLTDQLLKKA